MLQVSIADTHRHGRSHDTSSNSGPTVTCEATAAPCFIPFGGSEYICLGKSLAELEIRLLAVGLLKRLRLELVPDQDLTLMGMPSPAPKHGLWVNVVDASGGH